MYKLIVQSPTFTGLKDRLLEAAMSIDDVEHFAGRVDLSSTRATLDPELEKRNTTHIPITQQLIEDVAKEQLNAETISPVAQTVKVADSINIRKPAAEINYSDLDSEGMPWDERIHASSKAKNSDGSWRTRRGLEKSELKKVEAELLNNMKNTSVTASQPVSQPSGIPTYPQHAPAAPMVQTQPVTASPVLPPLPSAPPLAPAPEQVFTQPAASPFAAAPVSAPAVAPIAQAQPVATPNYDPIQIPQKQKPAHSFATFKANLIPTLSGLVQEGDLSQDYLGTLSKHFGVDQIWKVNDTQLGEMFDQFCSHGFITRVG